MVSPSKMIRSTGRARAYATISGSDGVIRRNDRLYSSTRSPCRCKGDRRQLSRQHRGAADAVARHPGCARDPFDHDAAQRALP